MAHKHTPATMAHFVFMVYAAIDTSKHCRTNKFLLTKKHFKGILSKTKREGNMSYYKGSIEFSSKTLENSDVLSDILEAFSSDKDNMCAGPGDNLFATFIDAAQKGDSLCVMSDYKKGPGFVLEFDRTRQIIMITVSRIEYGRFSELQDVLIKHKQSFNSYSFGDGNYGSQTCVYRADV